LNISETVQDKYNGILIEIYTCCDQCCNFQRTFE